jgi:hypothetical protein
MPHAVLADFGIGLLTDLDLLKKKDITTMGLTQTLVGSSSTAGSGTAMYMAPELLEGKLPSPQSDIYSLGVLLYQMVIGDLSRALATGWEEAVSDELLREDIAVCVAGNPENRLSDPSQLSERLRSLDQRRELLDAENLARAKEQDTLTRRQRTKKRLMIAGVIGLIVALTAVFSVLHYRNKQKEARKTWARETVMPEIQKLLQAEDYPAAYDLIMKAQAVIPDDPALKTYLDESTNDITIQTQPPGARISYKPYKDVDGPWIDLGISPLNKVRIPVGMHRWRIQKEGYQEREVAWAVFPRKALGAEQLEFTRKMGGDPFSSKWELYEEDRVPEGTIGVDRGRFQMALHGLFETPGIVLDRFFIDHTEVTNRAYKEFMENGAYRDSKFWKQQFKKDGQIISWAEAMKLSVDRTGQPGPSTWELGDYPEGQDDYPVSGVSWYEAAAYAEFRNKSLPTIFHWVRAAFPIQEVLCPITHLIVPQSNLEGNGPARVGEYPGIGSSGAKDMAGNVREWCWNGAAEEKRHCLGGMWGDPSYMFNNTFPMSEWDRSQGNGFRCVVYPEGASPSSDLLRNIDLGFYDPYSIPPYSKEVFHAMKAMNAYPRNPLNPVVEGVKEEGRGWKRETVSIDAAYNKERLILHIDLPTTGKPPFKAVVYFPGGNGWFQPKFTRNPLIEPWDAITKSGRAFITPVYSGLFERGGGLPDKSYKTTWIWEWLQDLGRTIDYLETRKDIDTKNIAFLGMSLGAQYGPFLTAFEDRIKVQVLVAGGISIPTARPKPAGIVGPHSTIPTLALNGLHDFLFPLETHQKPFLDLIGTPAEHKRHILYDAGHLPLPRAEMLKEILAWLDKYQGPVNSEGVEQQIESEK